MFSVSKNSKAYISGIQEGDLLRSINGRSSSDLKNDEATKLLRSANERLILELKQGNATCQSAADETNVFNHLNHTNSNPEFGSSDSFSSRSSLSGGGGQCPSDGELSTSTSDSQGSIIQVIGGRKHVLKTPSPCPSPVPVDCNRIKSTPLIWSPSGTTMMKSGKSYKQVTFNIPKISSGDEEIGADGRDRGRRKGRKEGRGGGGGAVGEMRNAAKLSNVLYSSANNSPGSNQLQPAAIARSIRPTDAFSLSKNSTSGSDQVLTFVPNGNEAGISSSPNTSCQGQTTTTTRSSTLPAASVQRGSSRDSSKDRAPGQDLRFSFDKRTPAEGTSGVSEFRANSKKSVGAPQRIDRYGITGTQNAVKSSNFTYTPFEVKVGRGVADDVSRLLLKVDTEAKLLESAGGGEPKGSSSCLQRPGSLLSASGNRGAYPVWVKGVKSIVANFESSKQVEIGMDRDGDRSTSPVNIFADCRRGSLPLKDSSCRSSPLIIKSSSVAPTIEQSKSVATTKLQCEKYRAEYVPLSPENVVENAKWASLPLRETGCKSQSPLAIRSSSVASWTGSVNTANALSSNSDSNLENTSRRPTDAFQNSTSWSFSSCDSSSTTPATVLLNNSLNAATCNSDASGYKSVSSIHFEGTKSPSRTEPTGYKSVSSISIESSKVTPTAESVGRRVESLFEAGTFREKSSAEPRRYRSISPLPEEAVQARSKGYKAETTGSTTVPLITDASHNRSVQPSTASGTLTSADLESSTHGRDSFSAASRRNWPSPFNQDSAQDSSHIQHKGNLQIAPGEQRNETSSTEGQSGINFVATESHKDLETRNNTQLSSGYKQPIRPFNSGLDNLDPNLYRSTSPLGFDILNSVSHTSENIKSWAKQSVNSCANDSTEVTKSGAQSLNQLSAWSTKFADKHEFPISSAVNQVDKAEESHAVRHGHSLQAVPSDAEAAMSPRTELIDCDNSANTWPSNNYSNLGTTSQRLTETLQSNKCLSPNASSSSKPVTAVPNQSVICINQSRTDPIPKCLSNSFKQKATTSLCNKDIETTQPELLQNAHANHVLPDCWSKNSHGAQFLSKEADNYGISSAAMSKSTANSVLLGSKSTSQIDSADVSKAETHRATVAWKSTLITAPGDDRAASVAPFAQGYGTGKNSDKVSVERLDKQHPYAIPSSSAHRIRLNSAPNAREDPVAMDQNRSDPLKNPAEKGTTSLCNSAESHAKGAAYHDWEPTCRPFTPLTLSSFTKTSGYRPIKFTPNANGAPTIGKSYRSASLSSDIPCRVVETNARHSSNVDRSVAPARSSSDCNSRSSLRPLTSVARFPAVDTRFSSVPPDSYRVFSAPDPSLPVISVTPPRPQSPVGFTAIDDASSSGIVKSPEIISHFSHKQSTKHCEKRDSFPGANSLFEVNLSTEKLPQNGVIANNIIKDAFTCTDSTETIKFQRERQPWNLEIHEETSVGPTGVNGNGHSLVSIERQPVNSLGDEATEGKIKTRIEANRDEARTKAGKELGFAPKLKVCFGMTTVVENMTSVPCPESFVGATQNVKNDFLQRTLGGASSQAPMHDSNFMRNEGSARNIKMDLERNSLITANKNDCENSWTYDELQQNDINQHIDGFVLSVDDHLENHPQKQSPYTEEWKDENTSVKCNGNWSRSEQLPKELSDEYSRRRKDSERRAREASRRPVLFREEKIPKPFIKYRGVGPKDQETGVPIALRNWVDGRSQREWYKEMYSVLHKKNDEYIRPSSAVPFAYRKEYRQQQQRPSLCMESDTEAIYRGIRQRKRSVSPAQSDTAAEYRRYRQYGAATYNGQEKEVNLEKFDWSSASNSSAESSDVLITKNSRDDGRNKFTTSDRYIDKNKDPTDYSGRKSSDVSCADEYWLLLAAKAMASQRSSSYSSYDEEIDRAMGMNTLQRPEIKTLTRTARGKARALYTFRTHTDKELSFKKGDVINLCKQIDTNWYEGQLNDGRKGLVPANYVEILISTEDAGQREGEAVAKYTFRGQTDLELSLQKGDVVTLSRRIDARWYEGRMGGRQGILPVTYVDIIREPRTPLDTPVSSLATTPRTGSPCGSSSASSDRLPSLPSIPVSPLSASPLSTTPVPATSPSLDFTQFDFDIDPQTNDAFAYRSDGLTSSQKSVMRNENQHLTSTFAAVSNGTLTRSRDTERDSNPRPSDRPGSASALLTGNACRSKTGTGSANYSSDREHSDDDMTMYNTLTNQLLRQLQRTTGGGAALKTTSGPCPDDIRDLLNGLGSTAVDASVQYPAYRALYDYKTQNDDELELKEGDVIYVMEKCEDGWFVGTSQRTDEFGTFPGNYVEKIE